MRQFYRYTYRDMGIFYAGKQLMPQELKPQYANIKQHAATLGFVKPELEKSPHWRYTFYFTEKGRELYESMYIDFHRRYLDEVITHVTPEKDLPYPICYEDEYQIAIKEVLGPVSNAPASGKGE